MIDHLGDKPLNNNKLRTPEEIQQATVALAALRERHINQPPASRGSSRWGIKLALASLVISLAINPDQLIQEALSKIAAAQKNEQTQPQYHFINMDYFLDTEGPRWANAEFSPGSPSVIIRLDTSPDPSRPEGNWYAERITYPKDPQRPIENRYKATGIAEALPFRGKTVTNDGRDYFLTEFQLEGLSGGLFLDNSAAQNLRRFVIEGDPQGLAYYVVERSSGLLTYTTPKTYFYSNPEPQKSRVLSYRTGGLITQGGSQISLVTPEGKLLSPVKLPWSVFEPHEERGMEYKMVNFGAFENRGSKTTVSKLLDLFTQYQ